MKTVRYIWIILGLLSVVAIEAATYGKPYQPQYQHRAAYFHAQSRADMPIATMGSVNSTMMYSGTALPLAAATGVSTTDDSPSNGGGGPRRIGGNTSGGSENREDPFEDPIGDAVLPLMLLALAYILMRARKKRQTEESEC